LNVFPIRSNVKLCSPLVAILDREQNNILREQDNMLWEQNNKLWEQDIILREQKSPKIKIKSTKINTQFYILWCNRTIYFGIKEAAWTCIEIVWRSNHSALSYLMKVIPETHCLHLIWYLRFYYKNMAYFHQFCTLQCYRRICFDNKEAAWACRNMTYG
jgi:hypothetical protein